jgi:hypothetical protein
MAQRKNSLAAPLSERIAAALRGQPAARDIQGVILDVDQETARLTEEESSLRNKATDPLTSDDEADGLRAGLFDIGFRLQRLAAARDRLQQALGSAQRREADERRKVDYERALLERDALVDELRKIYPEAAARIADLLRRICRNNATLTEINKVLPTGATQLEPVELVVRNVAYGVGMRGPDGSFGLNSNVSVLTAAVRLPALSGLDALEGRNFWERGDHARFTSADVVELARAEIAA